MVIFVDIDDTICTYAKKITEREYSEAIPIKRNIEKINKLYEQGHTIVYYTARGTLNVSRREEFRILTKMQLEEWGAKYHALSVGEKPVYDLLICDKTKRIEEV